MGDAAFQKKALGKMGAVVDEGRTVVFVSHNMAAVRNLTDRTICIRNGEIAIDAATGVAIEQYLYDFQTSTARAITSIEPYRRELIHDTPIRTTDIQINSNRTGEIAVVPMGEPLEIHLWLEAIRPIEGANLTIVLRNSRDERITTIFSWDYGVDVSVSSGNHHAVIRICGLSLPPGTYYLEVGINQTAYTRAYDVISGFPLFSVSGGNEIQHWPDRPWGAVHIPKTIWEIDGISVQK